jgi:hypothetical protein
MTEHADNHSTHYLWIVAANSEEYGRLYLADYAGIFEHDVRRKVMAGAERESVNCTLSERLAQLNWEIVRVMVKEVDPVA